LGTAEEKEIGRARIKVQDIVDDLNSQFTRALAEAVSEVLPDADVDEHELFRAFNRAVGGKCST